MFLRQDYRRFRLTIVNKGSAAASLRELRFPIYEFVFPSRRTNDIGGFVGGLSVDE
jgi:hypothetical protein